MDYQFRINRRSPAGWSVVTTKYHSFDGALIAFGREMTLAAADHNVEVQLDYRHTEEEVRTGSIMVGYPVGGDPLLNALVALEVI